MFNDNAKKSWADHEHSVESSLNDILRRIDQIKEQLEALQTQAEKAKRKHSELVSGLDDALIATEVSIKLATTYLITKKNQPKKTKEFFLKKPILADKHALRMKYLSESKLELAAYRTSAEQLKHSIFSENEKLKPTSNDSNPASTPVSFVQDQNDVRMTPPSSPDAKDDSCTGYRSFLLKFLSFITSILLTILSPILWLVRIEKDQTDDTAENANTPSSLAL